MALVVEVRGEIDEGEAGARSATACSTSSGVRANTSGNADQARRLSDAGHEEEILDHGDHARRRPIPAAPASLPTVSRAGRLIRLLLQAEPVLASTRP